MTRGIGLVMLGLAVITQTAAADDWQRLDYRIHTETDSLSDEKTTYARAPAWSQGSDAIDVEAACEGNVGVSFEFIYYRKNEPLELFSDKNDNETIRIRFDTDPVRNQNAVITHSNGISLFFIDKARVQSALKPGQSDDKAKSPGMAMAESLTGWLAQTAIESAATGTVLEFAHAQRIGAEIPLPNSGHVVVDLTPGNTVLRRFVADCIR